MEGVPRIPMVSFPLRRSADTPAFKVKLQKVISAEYEERPETYSREIYELECLRASAVHPTCDLGGVATLKNYYSQLESLKARFSLEEGSPTTLSFSWHDVFTDQVHSWADIKFEIASVLYNIGALHSDLGAKDSRATTEDMKNCVTHYQCAAWAFFHFRSNFQKFFTPDLSGEVLGVMGTVCLAQAQECVVEKSLVDNRRSTITAKLLVQIVDFYTQSFRTTELILKEQTSDKLTKALKKWKKVMELKISYYEALTFLFRGQQAEDQKEFGLRVTLYKGAQERVENALKLAKAFDKTDGVQETLAFAMDVILAKATAASKDNDFIYHEKVPQLDSIGEGPKGVVLVKPIPLQLEDPVDLFIGLVPMETHEVSSLYSEEKAALLRTYQKKIEEKEEVLQRTLLALQLHLLDTVTEEEEIPQELVDCCASMNAQEDGVQTLVELMSSLSGKFHDVDGGLKELRFFFQNEEELRIGLGKSSPSKVLVELKEEADKLEKAQKLAESSNQTLHSAVGAHVKNLRLLAQPLPQLISHLPVFKNRDSLEQESVEEMRRLRNKVEEMVKQRQSLELELRESLRADDITKKLVLRREDPKTLFREEMKKHERTTALLDQNLLAQDNILRALTEANAHYAPTRERTTAVLRERQTFVNSLITSYETYDELREKIRAGIQFYEKLEESLAKTMKKVKTVVHERYAKLPIINQPPPLTNQPLSSSTHHKLKDYLDSRKGQPNNPNLPNQITQPFTNRNYEPISEQTPLPVTPSAPYQQPSPNPHYTSSQPTPHNHNHSQIPSTNQTYSGTNQNYNYAPSQSTTNLSNSVAAPITKIQNFPSQQQQMRQNYPVPIQTPTNFNYPAALPMNQNYPSVQPSTNQNYAVSVQSQPLLNQNYQSALPTNQNHSVSTIQSYPSQVYVGQVSDQSQTYTPQPPSNQNYVVQNYAQTNQYYVPTATPYYIGGTEGTGSEGFQRSYHYSQSSYTPSEGNFASGQSHNTSTYSQAPLFSIQSPFSSTQTPTYPGVITRATYRTEENIPKYLGNAFEAYGQNQSFTPASQEINAYYAYNNMAQQTEVTESRDSSYNRDVGGHRAGSGTEIEPSFYSNQPSIVPSAVPSVIPSSQSESFLPPQRSTTLDLLAEIDLSAPPIPTLSPFVLHPSTEERIASEPDPQNLKTEPVKSPNRRGREPLTEASALEKLCGEVEKLRLTLESFDRKSLNGPTNLEMKWREVLELQNADSGRKSISVARCYPMKNRCPDIFPFDESRVPLPSTKDDYINASLLQRLSPEAIPLIVTQAPLPATYGDFWEMVWTQSVELIVSLVAESELKGDIYWPETRGREMEAGSLCLSLQSVSKTPTHIERTFSLRQKTSKTLRVVIQLQFTEWIGSVFPRSPSPLLAFLATVHNFYEQQRNPKRPVVLHCLPGVGRSGVTALLSAAMREVEAGNSIPDLALVGGSASGKRKGILIDREYLRYTYHALLFFLLETLRKHGVESGNSLEEKGAGRHRRHPSQDFLDDPFQKLLPALTESLSQTQKPEVVSQDPQTKTPVTYPSPLRALPKLIADLPPNLTSLDPATFRLKEREADRKELKRDAFESGKGALLVRKTEDPLDPLSALDPLWTIGK